MRKNRFSEELTIQALKPFGRLPGAREEHGTVERPPRSCIAKLRKRSAPCSCETSRGRS